MIGVSAVSRTTDSIDLIAWKAAQPNGSDGTIYASTWDVNQNDGQWSAFEAISQVGFGSQDTFAPAAIALTADRVDLLTVGPNREVSHSWWDGSWHAWADVTGGPQTLLQPTVVAQGAQRFDVFAVDYNTGAVWHNFFIIGDGWSNWISLGVPSPLTEPSSGNAYTSLAGVTRTADRIDLMFSATRDNVDVMQFFWNYAEADIWSTWVQLPADPIFDGLFAGAPLGFVGRIPTHLDVFSFAPLPGGASPDNIAVYSSWRDDNFASGTWQSWFAISPDTGVGQTLSTNVAAVSRMPDRIDLFVACAGLGSNSATGFYTTYWQDDTWDSPPLQLPPFSPVPIVTTPLDIPDHLSSSDLQARRYDIQQTFEANLAVPTDFTEAAPASTMTYLQEAYYFVPMYLANQLSSSRVSSPPRSTGTAPSTTTASPSRSATSTTAWSWMSSQPSVYALPSGLAVGPAEPACHRPDPPLRLHALHGAADRAVHVRLRGLAVHHRHVRIRRAGQDPLHDRAGAAQPCDLHPVGRPLRWADHPGARHSRR